MTDTGCPHPEPALLQVRGPIGRVAWCRLCGSLRRGGAWTAPSCIVLPGWTCPCGAFNGSAKELLPECRGCGAPVQLGVPA